MDLKEFEQLGDSISQHWYYRAKSNKILNLLSGIDSKIVLDVGAGSGFFSKCLLENSGVQFAICVDPNYPNNSDEIYCGKKLLFRKTSNSADHDLVLLMDVLEHVEDDFELLRGYVEQSKSGTTFLISVPAFMFLWSKHDEFLGHYRRYTLRQVELLADAVGLNLLQRSYYFAGVFPIAALLRLLAKISSIFKRTQVLDSQLKIHSKVVNNLLYALCRVEELVFRKNSWFGLTIFLVGRKAN